MNLPKESLIMFDIDGTLAQSKGPITEAMAEALSTLSSVKKIAIISGGNWEQFTTQIITHLPPSSRLDNIYCLPTSGTKLYAHTNIWRKIYAEELTEKEAEEIISALEKATHELLEKPATIYGTQIENRGSQISFSALGQEAPIEEKQTFDPDQKKRMIIVTALKEKLPDFEIRIGGTTTIDITKKGEDKAYGIQKIASYLSIPLSEIFYVGDALFEGGNDYAAKKIGLNCIQVKDEKETLTMLQDWLKIN